LKIRRVEITAYLLLRRHEKVPYYFNGRRVDFNGVEYLIGVGIDISDRIETERNCVTVPKKSKSSGPIWRGFRRERTRIAREISR
jgi:hypothetical protein